MSIRSTSQGYVCQRCGQIVTKLDGFVATMEAHDCNRPESQTVPAAIIEEYRTVPRVEATGKRRSIYTATAAERRNARPYKPMPHQQFVIGKNTPSGIVLPTTPVGIKPKDRAPSHNR